MKKAAIRYGISYIVMWAILGIVILGMPPDANLTQAGLMKRRSHVPRRAGHDVAAMEALATSRVEPDEKPAAAPGTEKNPTE